VTSRKRLLWMTLSNTRPRVVAWKVVRFGGNNEIESIQKFMTKFYDK